MKETVFATAVSVAIASLAANMGAAINNNSTNVHTTNKPDKSIVRVTDLPNKDLFSDINDMVKKFQNNLYATAKIAIDQYNESKVEKIEVKNLRVKADSVSSLKITWDADKDREYEVGWRTNAPYTENITFVFPESGVCYLTGLRVNEEYDITVTPKPLKNENEKKFEYVSKKKKAKTKNIPDVIQEYDHEDGWTNCFAGEKASGLTAMPSSGAIYGSSVDKVTGTGIRRFENGDYCCAMGTHYGYCNDRFLVELENGIQFTVRICDSKGCGDVQDEYGLGLYHRFGGSGKCIIEFIWDDGNLPGCVAFSGSWGGYNWNGLNLGANIKSIQKLATWD